MRGRRRRLRGFTTLETVLTIAAFLGCFVYPMAMAARAVGQQMAGSVETAHETILTQR